VLRLPHLGCVLFLAGALATACGGSSPEPPAIRVNSLALIDAKSNALAARDGFVAVAVRAGTL
jgi:hypothetical protein